MLITPKQLIAELAFFVINDTDKLAASTQSPEWQAEQVRSYIAQLRKDKEAAEALVCEQREMIKRLAGYAGFISFRDLEPTEALRVKAESAQKDAEALLLKTPASMVSRVEVLEDMGRKISAIRDSIVGCQGFNFSEHAYPLVTALDAAGFNGAGYEIASKNLGTLIEQRDKAEARIADLVAAGELLLIGYEAFGGDLHNNGPRMMRNAIAALKGGAPAAVHPDTLRLDWLDSFESDDWWNDHTKAPGTRGKLRSAIDAMRTQTEGGK